MGSGDTSIGGSRGQFPQTTLGLFSRILDPSDPEHRAALETLAGRYWKPVYRYLRIAWAKSNEDAKDLTQAFFLWMFEDEALKRFAPEKGSFRRFLKVVLAGFVVNADKALGRLKRGGGKRPLTLDDDETGLKESIPDPGARGPDQAFDLEWMRSVVKAAVERVRQRLEAAGRASHFEIYRLIEMSPEPAVPTYAQVAERLSLKESDVRRHLFGVREALREEIRAELQQTTLTPQALDEEWNELFGS